MFPAISHLITTKGTAVDARQSKNLFLAAAEPPLQTPEAVAKPLLPS